MRHLGPSIWSKLDAEVIASANLSSFKNNIRNVSKFIIYRQQQQLLQTL